MFKEEFPSDVVEDHRKSQAESLKVSIVVLTYNHERFIEQALEGAFNQKVQFSYEIVIADDCSRDRTPEIVRSIVRSNPDRCRILPRERNLGLCKNFADVYGNCRGQYVAILEGDDIWHNPRKLQRLAAILDSRTDASFVFHNVKLLFEDGREEASCCPPSLKSEFSLLDFVANNFVPNCSGVMFRNKLIRRFPDWFLRLPYYDWPLYILHLQHGPALYLSEALSTYRIHGSSAWHGASKSHQLSGVLDIFKAVDRHLEFQYDSILELNSKYWRMQFENEELRRHLQAAGCQLREVEERQKDLLNSKSYKLVRILSGVKQLAKRFRFPETKAA